MGCPVVEWQILSTDPGAAAAFYGSLFGWKVSADNPLGYRRVLTESAGGIDGGIWPSPPEGGSFVQLFVRVDSVAEALARAVALGASPLIGPVTLPEGDELAIVRDPAGMPFGLLGRAPAPSPDRPERAEP